MEQLLSRDQLVYRGRRFSVLFCRSFRDVCLKSCHILADLSETVVRIFTCRGNSVNKEITFKRINTSFDTVGKFE